jgi:hypothetical protein
VTVFTLTATAADQVTGQSGQAAQSFTVAASGPAVIAAAAGPWTGAGQGTRTLAVAPSAAGNLLVLEFSGGGGGAVSALSAGVAGGGVTTWQRACGYLDTGDHLLAEIWYGVVTAPGGATVTVTNASAATEWDRLQAREYTASGTSLTWQLAAASPAPPVTSASPSGSGAAVTFPALAGTGLYVAAAQSAWGTLTAGTSPGYAYAVTDQHLLTAWNPAASAPPACTSSDSGDRWARCGALLTASSTSVQLAVTTATLPGGVAGQSYSQSLAATGGVPPYTWSVTAGTLPAGLSLSGGGVISGTPPAAGTSSFTVRVTDGASSTATRLLGITVTASPPVVFTGAYPPDAHATYMAPALDPQISLAGNTHAPYVDLDVWGPVGGETVASTIYSVRNWSIAASMSNGNGSVTCFPNCGLAFPVSLPWNNWSYFISGWDETMDAATAQTASACYDNWVDNTLVNPVTGQAIVEIMLHFDFRNRGAGPWYAQGVQFGGYTVNGIAIPVTTWNLAYSGTAVFWNLVDAGGAITSLPAGAVDLLAMNRYLVSHGFISATCHHTGISIGYEICDTGGAVRNYRYNNLWCYAA